MATVTSLGVLFNSTAGTASNKFVTATPAVGDLIVVVTATTGLVGGTTAVTDDNPDGLGTYLQVVGPATGAGATGCVSIWIRNALIGTATSTVFTEAENGSSGGGLNVFSVAGMTFAGLAAVYSSGITNSGLAVTTPSVAMSPAPDTTLPVIAAVSNSSLTNAGAPTSPAYTEALDGSYITPTLGLETMFINSGETRNPITWRNSSPSGYGAVVVQLDTSTTDAVGGVRLTLVGHARRVRGG